LFTVMVLVAMVLVGLGVPLALTGARAAVQREFVDRLSDTVRFAALAQRPLVDADTATLLPEMQRYDQVYGVAVALVGQDCRPLVSSRPGMDVDSYRVKVALAGRRSEPYQIMLLWTGRPMLLAEPVLLDGEVRGAVVTISPTSALRRDVFIECAALFLGGLVMLGLAAMVALPVVRWILRPVRRLDSGLARVAGSVLSGEPAEPVGEGDGPPELRELTRSFDQMAAAVTQALAAQRAFVADASHQLRNPLTALRLRLNNLEDRPGPGRAEEHQAALEEADRLGEVLDGLLALARAERAPTGARTIDLDEVLADRLDAWGVLAEHETLRLSRTGRERLRVRVPPGTLETVLDALLDNAIKFSPPGGEITVHTESEDGRVNLAVRDHGPGIAADEMDRATDRFWRSPTQHNVDGSGLGLAIARSTVRRAGGALSLDLPPGGGLRVLVALPPAD
jgi:signal transduction histidine kinase